MRIELFCYVNVANIDEAKKIISRCDGKIIDKELKIVSKDVFKNEKFKVLNNFDFVSIEIIFDNMFDFNRCCYELYMSCGYHFFIENAFFVPD